MENLYEMHSVAIDELKATHMGSKEYADCADTVIAIATLIINAERRKNERIIVTASGYEITV